MAIISNALVTISDNDAEAVLSTEESHFADIKSKDISPAKLTRTVSAFANAEGGEIFLGIDEDLRLGLRSWRGFDKIEDANGFIQTLESMAPLGDDILCNFLRNDRQSGIVLKIDVKKTGDIKSASDGQIYIRKSAQNLPVRTDEALGNLKRAKGLTSFENETIASQIEIIIESAITKSFISSVVPQANAEEWLRKQRLIVGQRPTVAGILLFNNEPQAVLPKRSGIKIYRYKTTDSDGTRDTLAGDPISIEGHVYKLIKDAVEKTTSLIESVNVSTGQGLQRLKYPQRALHEIITNAVLHRDYAIADDIHIRIFDNRVEVHSPGTLPGHITPENIRQERFSRNAQLVRLINKFPDPPNKDIGEGLNTAFDEMRKMKLKEPFVAQTGNYVRIDLRHEPLASPEEIILEYLARHDLITNKEARTICFVGSENKMKGILQRMVKNRIIELVPGRTRYNAAYRIQTIDQSASKQGELF